MHQQMFEDFFFLILTSHKIQLLFVALRNQIIFLQFRSCYISAKKVKKIVSKKTAWAQSLNFKLHLEMH
jgi:hypothetical protein